jgi:putative PEP-CTERM system TPR-repeat lipoprotein
MAHAEAALRHDKEGLGWLEKAKAAHPAAIAPRLYLGAYHLRNRNYAQAQTELTEALRSNPDNPQLLELLGQAELGARNNDRAVTTFEKLAKLRPDSPEANFWLGNARLATQDATRARESFAKALQLKPDFADAAFALAGLDVRDGRVNEALQRARDLQTRTPSSPAGLILEGDVLLAQRREADAVAAYEKAFALRESNLLAVKLHAARVAAGDRDADAKLERWLQAHPSEISGWHYLAEQAMKSGRNDRAQSLFERVIKQEPDNAAALNNLALLYLQNDDPRSVATAERAYRAMPGSPAVADTLGWILVQRGDPARGVDLLQRAVAANRDNATLRYHLAVGLARTGDKATARRELDALLAGNRSFAERDAAQRLREQL